MDLIEFEGMVRDRLKEAGVDQQKCRICGQDVLLFKKNGKLVTFNHNLGLHWHARKDKYDRKQQTKKH